MCSESVDVDAVELTCNWYLQVGSTRSSDTELSWEECSPTVANNNPPQIRQRSRWTQGSRKIEKADWCNCFNGEVKENTQIGQRYWGAGEIDKGGEYN